MTREARTASHWLRKNWGPAAAAACLCLAGLCLAWIIAGTAAAQNPTTPRLKLERELVLAPNHGRGAIYTYGIPWSSDGTKLAAYSSLGSAYSATGNLVTVWNSDGHLFRELAGTREWFFDAVSPLVFIGDKEIVTPPPQTRPDLAFSVFDVDSGKVVEQVEGLRPQRLRGDPPGHAVNSAKAFAVSPDQTVLAVAFGWGLAQPIALYSTKTWERLSLIPASPGTAAERAFALAFAPNGVLLGTARGNTHIQIYDRASERVLHDIDAFPEAGGLHAIAFSPDSRMIAAGSGALPFDRSDTGQMKPIAFRERVRVFRVDDGSQAVAFPDLTSPVHGLAWSARGLIAFMSSDGTVRVWDPNSAPASAARIRLRAAGVAFSPDGTRLAVPAGSTIRIYDIEQ